MQAADSRPTAAAARYAPKARSPALARAVTASFDLRALNRSPQSAVFFFFRKWYVAPQGWPL